jgi:hypothetical protein
VNKLSLISESVVEIRINNQPCRGINLTNTTYVCPWIGHVWQPFAMTTKGQSGSHLSLVHIFHVRPYAGLSVGGPYTIPMLTSGGMVGYCPTTTIIELCRFTRGHKSDRRSVHNQMLVQRSNMNGPQLTQVGAITLEPQISIYHSPSFPSYSPFT